MLCRTAMVHPLKCVQIFRNCYAVTLCHSCDKICNLDMGIQLVAVVASNDYEASQIEV